MTQKIKHIVRLLTMTIFAIFIATSCQPDPAVYEAPSSLAGTIDEQLESMGNYSHYLKALGKTIYLEPLSKGGSWTVFAPNDDAFEAFLEEEGYASVDDMPSSRIYHLIQNSIVTDAWNTNYLTYVTRGWYAGNGMRRRTQYADTIELVDPVDFPYTENLEANPFYLDKSFTRMNTISYFLPAYLNSQKNLSEPQDVEWAFDKELTIHEDGEYFQVYETNVSQKNIVAENGIIHGIDAVSAVEPRNNLYENLNDPKYAGKYSIFKSLVDRFSYISSNRYEFNEETGFEAEIFILNFHANVLENTLSYNLNDENFPKYVALDQTQNYASGLLVPTNDAMLAYLDDDTNVIGQFFDSYDEMSLEVLGRILRPYFLQYWYNACPSHQGEVYDVKKNSVDYKLEDAVDKYFCSNGLFVGVDKVYPNSSFSTVLGKLLIDPDYGVMLTAIQNLGIEEALASKSSRYSIFGIKNDQFIEIDDPNSPYRKITVKEWTDDFTGIQIEVTGDPEPANNRLYPTSLITTDGTSSADALYVKNTLKAIVLNQIVDADVDLNGDTFYQTRSGDFLYLNNDEVAGAGDLALNRSATVDETLNTDNGIFYEMTTFLERPLDYTYKVLSDNSDKFSLFLDVLEAAELLDEIPLYTEDKLLAMINLNRQYTLFAPNNTAVQQAIDDGVIPDPSNMPTDELELAFALDDLNRFVNLHIIQVAIATDGVTSGGFSTLHYERKVDFQPLYIDFNVENTNTGSDKALTIKNVETGDVVAETTENVNLFSRSVVIHEIDTYLNY